MLHPIISLPNIPIVSAIILLYTYNRLIHLLPIHIGARLFNLCFDFNRTATSKCTLFGLCHIKSKSYVYLSYQQPNLVVGLNIYGLLRNQRSLGLPSLHRHFNRFNLSIILSDSLGLLGCPSNATKVTLYLLTNVKSSTYFRLLLLKVVNSR